MCTTEPKEPVPDAAATDAADRCAEDTTLAQHAEHADEAGAGEAPRVGHEPLPAVEETAAAVDRARDALARLAQSRGAHARAGDAERVEQLTRWHADDHAEDHAEDRDDQRAAGWQRELEGSTR